MNKVFNFLIENGFNPHISESSVKLSGSTWRSIFKNSIDSSKECLTNDKTPKISVDYYTHNINGKPHEVYEVSIVNENNLGWVDIKFYGLSEKDMLENYQEIENRLIKAWEASWSDNEI